MERKIYLISDTHFEHCRDFLFKPRGFNNIDEHDEYIINKWNSVVEKDDIVYHLGDLAMNNIDAAIEKIKKLNGKIILIRGNHCTDKKIEMYRKLDNIVDIKYADVIKYKKWSFYLSHYPSMMGNVEDQSKNWNLSGHTHSKDKFENGKYKIYNVACDAHDCTPIEIEDILNDIRKYKTDVNNGKIDLTK